MSTPYKDFALDLKHEYIAQTRLLSTYKMLILSGNILTFASNNSIIDSKIDKELLAQVNNTQKKLRALHLIRAFIKGVPYKSVEPKCEVDPLYVYVHFDDELRRGLSKFYNKKENSEQAWAVVDEMVAWIDRGVPSKFFARPVKEIGYDGNGSPV